MKISPRRFFQSSILVFGIITFIFMTGVVFAELTAEQQAKQDELAPVLESLKSGQNAGSVTKDQLNSVLDAFGEDQLEGIRWDKIDTENAIDSDNIGKIPKEAFSQFTSTQFDKMDSGVLKKISSTQFKEISSSTLNKIDPNKAGDFDVNVITGDKETLAKFNSPGQEEFRQKFLEDNKEIRGKSNIRKKTQQFVFSSENIPTLESFENGILQLRDGEKKITIDTTQKWGTMHFLDGEISLSSEEHIHLGFFSGDEIVFGKDSIVADTCDSSESNMIGLEGFGKKITVSKFIGPKGWSSLKTDADRKITISDFTTSGYTVEGNFVKIGVNGVYSSEQFTGTAKIFKDKISFSRSKNTYFTYMSNKRTVISSFKGEANSDILIYTGSSKGNIENNEGYHFDSKGNLIGINGDYKKEVRVYTSPFEGISKTLNLNKANNIKIQSINILENPTDLLAVFGVDEFEVKIPFVPKFVMKAPPSLSVVDNKIIFSNPGDPLRTRELLEGITIEHGERSFTYDSETEVLVAVNEFIETSKKLASNVRQFLKLVAPVTKSVKVATPAASSVVSSTSKNLLKVGKTKSGVPYYYNRAKGGLYYANGKKYTGAIGESSGELNTKLSAYMKKNVATSESNKAKLAAAAAKSKSSELELTRKYELVSRGLGIVSALISSGALTA